jgi:hypothetical protein
VIAARARAEAALSGPEAPPTVAVGGALAGLD